MKYLLVILGVLLIAGCTGEGGAPFEHRVNASHPLDDGSMLVFKDMIGVGMISGEDGDLLLGDFKAGNYSVIARALYRFNISDWNGSNVVFHLLCTDVYGIPGAIEVYLVSDFGRLPLRPTQPLDINATWSLVNAGDLIGQVSPGSGDWFTVTIPASKISNRELSLILKLSNESLADGNYYVLHSYERGEQRNQQKPYLTYE